MTDKRINVKMFKHLYMGAKDPTFYKEWKMVEYKPKHPTPSEFSEMYGKGLVVKYYTALYESHQKLERLVNAQDVALDKDNNLSSIIDDLTARNQKLKAELAEAKINRTTEVDWRSLRDERNELRDELAKQTKLVERATVYLNNHDYNFTHFKPKDMCACFKCDWLKDAGGE